MKKIFAIMLLVLSLVFSGTLFNASIVFAQDFYLFSDFDNNIYLDTTTVTDGSNPTSVSYKLKVVDMKTKKLKRLDMRKIYFSPSKKAWYLQIDEDGKSLPLAVFDPRDSEVAKTLEIIKPYSEVAKRVKFK